jgi:hypothetical protein
MYSQLGIIVNGPWTAIECVCIPPMVNDSPLNTLGFPLFTSSDAHYSEHVARRPFKLDISAEELLGSGNGTEANMEVFKQALRKRL